MFHTYSASQIASLTNSRPGETKLGDTIRFWDSATSQADTIAYTSPYCLLGIAEDMGVRANFGLAGTGGFWNAALPALLNVQQANDLQGPDFTIAGYFDFDSEFPESESMSIPQLREAVAVIDEAAAAVAQRILKAGMMPIVIGGGHNNAYPLIKALSLVHGKPVNAINLDAHADYRLLEGRHSGNPFSYARYDCFLDKYAVLGLQKSYNSSGMIETMAADPHIDFEFWDDILFDRAKSFEQSLERIFNFCHGTPCGLELDMDVMAGVLSSAASLQGISISQARQFVHAAAAKPNIGYFHLPEGVVQRSDGRADPQVAKLAACLIADFARSRTAYSSRKS